MEKVEIKKGLVDFTLTNGCFIQMNMANARRNHQLSPITLWEKAQLENMDSPLLSTLIRNGWEQIDHEDLKKLNAQLADFYLTGIKDDELNSFIKNLMNATYEILDGYKRKASMMICSNPMN